MNPGIKTILTLCGLFFLWNATDAQTTFSPEAWWNFETPPATGRFDVSGNGHHITANVLQINPIPGGPVGRYRPFNPSTVFMGYPAIPLASYPAPDRNDTVMSVEFITRIVPGWDGGVFLRWGGRFEISLGNNGWRVTVYTEPGQARTLLTGGIGVNNAAPNFLLDLAWHHIAATWDGKIGELKLYVDGVCPPNFTANFGLTPRLQKGGTLNLLNGGGSSADIKEADLDEIAVYNDVLSPGIIYQHYQEAILNQTPYTFTQTIANNSVPSGTAIATGGFNRMEFAPGYPNVTKESIDLLREYPGPRYRDSLHRIMPFCSDLNRVYKILPQSSTVHHQGAADLQRELVKYYNYFLQLGTAAQYRPTNALTNPAGLPYHFIQLANEPALQHIPRAVIAQWGEVPLSHIGISMSTPAFSSQGLTDDYYVTDDSFGTGRKNPYNTNNLRFAWDILTDAAKVDTLQYDGDAITWAIRKMAAGLNLDHIDFFSENGENITNPFTPNDLDNDATVVNHRISLGSPSWNSYQAHGAKRFFETYFEPILNYIGDTLNAGIRPATQVYHVAGDREFRYDYDTVRTLNFTPADQRHRPAPQYYPQRPAYWLRGLNGLVTGMVDILDGLPDHERNQDSLFNPFVSPGFTDGGTYNSTDINHIRPGQYLGILKMLAGLGADTYTNFMFNNSSADRQEGNWRVWKLVVPPLAQAVTSRCTNYLTHGDLQPGLPAFIGNVVYNNLYPTGQPQDWAVARRLRGTNQFMITGLSGRTTNAVTNGDQETTIGIPMLGDSLILKVRLQGSTYLYNKDDTTLVQLDGWHEWKDPWYWCHDFQFEAENHDNPQPAAKVRTENENQNDPFDFTEFTTYLQFPGPTLPTLRFNLLRKVPQQDNMYCWVRARSADGNPAGLNAWYNTSLMGNAGAISDTSWQWYRIGNAQFIANITTTIAQVLEVAPTSTNLELDKVVLTSSMDSLGRLQAEFIVTDHCFGVPIPIQDTSTTGGGCIEHDWDFGNGIHDYSSQPNYIYPTPGTYTITLILTESITGETDTVTHQVVVNAPNLVIPNDTIICADDTLQLWAIGNGIIQWDNHPTLSNPYISNPVATPTQTTYYTANLTDPITLCQARDSFRVNVLAPRLDSMPDRYICLGQSVQLRAFGMFGYKWDNGGTLSNDTIPDPIATPTTTTTYTVRTWDACACDTAVGTVTVYVLGTSTPVFATATPDSICEGDTVQLQSGGLINYEWWPFYYVTDEQIPNPQAFPVIPSNMPDSTQRTWTFTLQGEYCTANGPSDTLLEVPITVFRAPRVNINQDTLAYCPGLNRSVTAGNDSMATFTWSPSGWITSVTTGGNVVTVQPTQDGYVYVTSTHIITGCTATDSVYLMSSGVTQDQYQICSGDSITFQARGHLAAATFSWSPPQAFANPTGPNPSAGFDTTTTVIVTITTGGQNQCTTQDTIQVNITPPVTILTPDTVICDSNPMVQLTATGPDFYYWAPIGLAIPPNTGTTQVDASQAQWFIVAGMDSIGCLSQDSVHIQWHLTPGIITPDTTICLGDTVTLTIQGGTNYFWQPNFQSTQSITESPTVNTLYQVNITDSVCPPLLDTVQVTVLQPHTILTPDTLICYGDTATLQTSGGNTFAWTPATGLSATNVGNPQAYPTAPTWYYVTITDTAGCTSYDSVFVDVAQPHTILTPDTLICYGDTAQLHTTGGSLFTWSPAGGLSSPFAANPQANPLLTTEYFVLITDMFGCNSLDSVTVSVSIPQGITTPDTLICLGDSIQLQTTGGAFYAWTPGIGLSSTNSPNPTANPTVNTQYEVLITDGNGCESRDSVQISVSVPQSILTPDTLICYGDTATLQTSGGNTFAWTPATGLSSISSGSPQVFPTNNTTYIVVISDSNGCKSLDSVTISVSVPQGITTPDTLICLGDSIQLQTTGGAFFAWTPGIGLSSTNSPNPTANPTVNTQYEVLITDGNGCESRDSVQISVSVPHTILTPDTLICYGDTATLQTSGGNTFAWTPATGLSATNVGNPQAYPASATWYYVTITDTAGCTSYDSVFVDVAQPHRIITPDTTVCAGINFTIYTTGGSTFAWLPGAELSNTTVQNPTAFPSASTQFTVVITDANGCQSNDTLNVGVWPVHTILTPDTTICFGDTFQIRTTGGNQFNWAPATDLSGTSVGNPYTWPHSSISYTVDIRDTNGCQAQDTLNIHVVPAQVITPPFPSTICQGDSVPLNATGGITWSWQPTGSITDPNAQNTYAIGPFSGDYTVVIQDTANCTWYDTLSLTYGPYLGLLTPDTALCLGDSIILRADTGGTYYTWGPQVDMVDTSHTDTTTLWANRANTVFAVEIQTAAGCTFTDSVTVLTDTLCCIIPSATVYHNDTLTGPYAQTGGLITVQETLWVSGAVTFTGVTFEMQPYAVIWVLPGGTFTANQCTLRAGCGVMWESVVLEQGAEGEFNGCLVQDAIYGITSQGGAEYRVNGTLFRANFIGIKVESFAGAHPGTVRSSRFTGHYSLLLPPFPSQYSEAGMWLLDVGNLQVGDPSNPAQKNYFDSLGIGILAERTNATVENCQFNSLQLKPLIKSQFQPGYGAYGTGIHARGYPGTAPPMAPKVIVGGSGNAACQFEDMTFGIRLRDNARLDATGNQFDDMLFGAIRAGYCTRDTVRIIGNSIHNAYYGIYSELNTGIRMIADSNTITTDAQHPGTGMTIWDIATYPNQIASGKGYSFEGNTFDGWGTGFEANATAKVLLRRNTIILRDMVPGFGVQAGIKVSASDSARIVENTLRYIGPGGNADPADGIRLNSSTRCLISCNNIQNWNAGFHTFGSCDFSTLRNNEFRNGGTGVLLEMNGVIGQQGNFGQPSGNKWINWNCSGGLMPMIRIFNTNTTGQNWLVRNNLFQNPTHFVNLTNGCSGNFPSGLIQSTGGPIYSGCATYSPSGGGSGSGNLRQIADGSRAYEAYPAENLYQDRQMALDMMEENSAICMGDPLLGACHANWRNGTEGKIRKANRHAALLDVNGTTSTAWAPQNGIEQNHRDVLQIWSALVQDTGRVNPADSALIAAIAQQCPVTGGRAVWQARSLMAWLAPGMAYDDRAACNPAQKQSGQGETNALEPESTFILAPNPTSRQVQVHWEAQGTVEVWNMAGVRVHAFDRWEETQTIDVSGWPKGLYLFRYRSEEGFEGTVRLTVQ